MDRVKNLNNQFDNKDQLIKVTVLKDKKVAIVEFNPPTSLTFLSLPIIKALNQQLLSLEKN